MPDDSNSVKDFDIVISYASEDGDVARQIARKLRDNNVNVFFADFYQDDLWGKDLSVSLEEIFRDRADYCLMLVSENYVKKFWTTQEKQYAIARQMREKRRYILQIKLDDTKVPGISDTIHYKKFDNVENTVSSIINILDLQKPSNFSLTIKVPLSPSGIAEMVDRLYGNKSSAEIENAIMATEAEIEKVEDVLSIIDYYSDETEGDVRSLLNQRRNLEIELYYLRAQLDMVDNYEQCMEYYSE